MQALLVTGRAKHWSPPLCLDLSCTTDSLRFTLKDSLTEPWSTGSRSPSQGKRFKKSAGGGGGGVGGKRLETPAQVQA